MGGLYASGGVRLAWQCAGTPSRAGWRKRRWLNQDRRRPPLRPDRRNPATGTSAEDCGWVMRLDCRPPLWRALPRPPATRRGCMAGGTGLRSIRRQGVTTATDFPPRLPAGVSEWFGLPGRADTMRADRQVLRFRHQSPRSHDQCLCMDPARIVLGSGASRERPDRERAGRVRQVSQPRREYYGTRIYHRTVRGEVRGCGSGGGVVADAGDQRVRTQTGAVIDDFALAALKQRSAECAAGGLRRAALRSCATATTRNGRY